MAIVFDMPEENASIIKVIGVGGGGNNAVNYMYEQGIKGVNFIICNTDAQALEMSPVPLKVQLGPELTSGRGAGSLPEIGREASMESEEEIRQMLMPNTKMVFVTAGMGGGTGTGGAPVVARIAKELGLLTVGIVTQPFDFEGKRKRGKADDGIDELKKHVDAIIIISNNKLRDIYGNLSLSEAFGHADSILTTAAKGISEIITKAGVINVDFEDVKTVMSNSGIALMGTGIASGENRALKAIDAAMTSPLLNHDDICGANGILLNITSGGDEIKMDEVTQITEYVQQAAANDTEIIWGVCHDETVGEEIIVTLIATGFDEHTLSTKKAAIIEEEVAPSTPSRIVHSLEEAVKKETPAFVPPVQPTNILDEQPVNLQDEIRREEAKIDEFFELQMKTERVEMKVEKEEIIENPNQIDFTFDEPEVISPQERTVVSEPISMQEDDFEALHRERMKKLKSIVSLNKLRNKNNLRDMENEPAYMRRKIDMEDQEHSSENSMSRLGMDDSYNANIEESFDLRERNSFLHDNVD